MPGAISNGSFRFASACAASARCSSLNASRFAIAAARRSAFEAPTVMQLLFRRTSRHFPCHHPPCAQLRTGARDPVFPGARVRIAEPRRTGYSAFAEYDGGARGTSGNQRSNEETKCEAAESVEALDPGVPYESRWAPYDRIHGPGQGQFPEGSIRPRGYWLLTRNAASQGQCNYDAAGPPALRRSRQPIATPPPMVRFSICVVFSMRSAAALSALATAVWVARARSVAVMRTLRSASSSSSSALILLLASSNSSHTVSAAITVRRASPISPNLPRNDSTRASRLSANLSSRTSCPSSQAMRYCRPLMVTLMWWFMNLLRHQVRRGWCRSRHRVFPISRGWCAPAAASSPANCRVRRPAATDRRRAPGSGLPVHSRLGPPR